VIIRRLTYECDIPKRENSFIDEWKGYPNFVSFPVPSLPDGWHYFTGYVGMLTNAMICPKHTIRFSDGEVVLHRDPK